MKKLTAFLSIAVIYLSASATPLTLAKTNTIDGVSVEFRWNYDADFANQTAKLLSVEPAPVGDVEIPSALLVSVINKSLAITEIGESAFANARAITKVTIPPTVERIGDYAFSNCTALAALELSYGIRRIGKRPFVNTAIPELTLPDTLLEMDGNIAAGAIYDMKLNISDSSHFTFSDDGVLYNKDMTKLYACPTRAEGTVTIPSTVTNICQDAFFGCFRLSYLNIPENVNTIGSDAFNVYGIWPDLIWNNRPPPESTPKLQSIFYNGPVPNAADDIYEHAPAELVSYVFTDGWENPWKNRPVTVIDEAHPPVLTIKDADGITWHYRIVNGTVEIYNEDANGNAITAITPKSTAGSRYYEDKDSINYRSALKIPGTINGYAVTRIGNHAFDGCKALTYVGIPASVEEIGDYAFKGCTAIRAIEYIDGVPFRATDGQIVLPGGVTKVGYHPFEGTKASYVSIPYTVNSMDGNPLAGMDYVTTVEVDADNPKFYASGNIIYNKGKTSVIGVPANYDGASIAFLASASEIGPEALYGCANLGTITLPAALETISANAFAGCSGLAAITIPATVTKIETAVFSNCTSLVKVTYEGNAPTAPDTLYAGTPTELTSYAGKDKGFTETTWKDRPIEIQDDGTVPKDDELSCSDGGLTWYFRVVDGVAEIWRKDSQSAVISDEPILNLALPQTLGGYIVKGIGDGALANLRGITSLSVPDTYEWIGDNAFSNCTSLASVSLGKGIEEIGHWPFFGTKLTTLLIPDSVTAIDGNPVAGCSMMRNVSVADTQPYFSVDADGLLYDKKQETLIACPATLSSITLPDTLKTINDDAFYGCDLLDSTSTTANGATWIFSVNGNKATVTDVFGASGDILIPESLNAYPVVGIQGGAFAGCSNITSFASESAAFSTRNGILYSADGTTLVCVPDTLTLPYLVTTSNTSMTITLHSEAGASDGLPYVIQSATTNKPVTRTSSVSMQGDISFEELLKGVTNISDYAFCGVNIFTDTATTNISVTGETTPGEGVAYADVTRTLIISSITYSTPVPSSAVAAIVIAPNAFSKSGLSYESSARLVTFDTNGGSAPASSRVVAKGKAVGALPTPTRKGYTFKGWFTKPSGGTKIKTTTKVKKNVTYYAQWTANKYTIKFNANGGTGTMKSLSATYGKNMTLTVNAFKRTNYTFLGWARKKDSTEVEYKDKVKVKNLTATNGKTVTLYAVWKSKTYTVKFNANGGAGAAQTQSLNCGSSVKLAKNTYVREGFAFAGWATKKNGSVVYKNKAAVKDLAKSGKSVTLYAVWKPAAWAVGTFKGSGKIGGKAATVTLTVASSGKISGKFVRKSDKKSFAFKGDTFTEFKEGALRVTTTLAYGSKTCELDIAVAQDGETDETFAELLVIYGGKAYGEASVK